MQDMYERMRRRIESVVEKGQVTDEDQEEHELAADAFRPWKQEASSFTPQQHPSVIQVNSVVLLRTTH